MAVDPTGLREIAERLKRATTNRDVLALCEGVMAGFGPVKADEALPVSKPGSCPECERRRSQRTAAQRRWRGKKSA